MKQIALSVSIFAASTMISCSSEQGTNVSSAAQAPPALSSEATPSNGAAPVTFAEAVEASASRAKTSTFESCVAHEVAFWGAPRTETAEEAFGAKCEDLPLDECVNDLARRFRIEAGDKEAAVSLDQIDEWESACGAALSVGEPAMANAGEQEQEPTSPREHFMWQLKWNIATLESLQTAKPVTAIYSPENDGMRGSAFAIDEDLIEIVQLAQVSDQCVDTISRYRNPLKEMIFSAWKTAIVDGKFVIQENIEDQERSIRSAFDNLGEWCSEADVAALGALGGEAIDSIRQGVRIASNRIAREEQIAAERKRVSDQQLAQRVEAIRAGRAEPESFKEAAAAFNPESGLNVVYSPLVTPDQRAVMISASLESLKDGLLIAKAGNSYFAVVIPPGSRAEIQAGGLRHRGAFHLVGRYIDNMEYKTVIGQTMIMPVFSSVWLGDGMMQN